VFWDTYPVGVFLNDQKETAMANISIDIPDELITRLDLRAKRENRSRNELLCKAAQQYLGLPNESASQETEPSRPEALSAFSNTSSDARQWTREELEQYLLDKGVIRRGCPELEALLGPVAEPVDMAKVLEIGKKLKGLSQQIIDDRKDRV
jgi:hypothetical protein